MIDVNEYLNRINKGDGKVIDIDESVREHDQEHSEFTKRSGNYKSNYEFEESTNFDRSIQDKTKNIASQKQLTSASTKAGGVYSRSKKDMKEFMKSQLAKTKQTGNDAIFMVGKLQWFLFDTLASSTVGQKTKHFVPKKRKDSAKDQNNKRKRTDSKGRNSSSKKRLPLKPNLKGTKPVNKKHKATTNEASQAQRKASINTNPFKPPKAPSKEVSKIIKSDEAIKDSIEAEQDDEIQSDYGINDNKKIPTFEGSKVTIIGTIYHTLYYLKQMEK